MQAARRDPEVFAAALRTCKGEEGDLIPLLQAAQEAYGYVSEEAMRQIHERTGIPRSRIYGVVTFYKQLRLKPCGKLICKVCNGTACHVNGSKEIEAKITEVLGVGRGDTTPDGLFTVESVNCLGCCSLAPVVMVNDDTFGGLTPVKTSSLLKRLQKEAA